MYRIRSSTWTLVILLLAALVPARSMAIEPFVNLGFTSFLDGFGDPTGSGFALVQYVRYGHSSSLRDADGKQAAAFRDPRLTDVVSLTQLLYTLPKPAGLGIGVIVPVVYLDADFAPGGASLRDNGLGVGDVFVGPSYQFAPMTLHGRPLFVHRFEFDVQVPVGNYDPTIQITQGNNAWALNPFWAATLLPLPRIELSWRLHWLYNFENPEPIQGPVGSPAISTTQAGQAIHANIAASYEVLPNTLRVGVSSYFLKQITDSKENGVSVGGTREQVVGIGPGAVWFPTKWDLVFLNFYYETGVRNRFQIHSVQLRWGHAFAAF